MDNISSNSPTGADAIKGGFFFGSNLTPGGVFANLPNITTAVSPTSSQQQKLVLTLEQVKEELRKQAMNETGSSEDPLSEESINTFLTSFVQLLIDYRDVRNYVFFGSSYTELIYHINTLINTYPYKSYFAQDVNTQPGIQLTSFSGSRTRVAFNSSDILFPGTFVYNDSGTTLWPNFDLIDINGTRFPIISINSTLTIIDASNTGPIIITCDEPHNLVTGDSVIITNVTGNTAANGSWTVTVITPTTFSLDTSIGNGVYVSGGSVQLTNIAFMVSGNISVNNFIEYEPNLTQLFKGLIVSPKQQALIDFDLNTTGEQKALLSPLNETPWPREPITNNIITQGVVFDNWVENPTNMVPAQDDDLGVLNVTDNSLNLRGALALDEVQTNQLLRRAIPDRLVDELNDTEDKLFTRFVLIAGRFFDFIKIYIDFLKFTHTINYAPFNQLSPEYYKEYAEHYGFDLFDDDNIELAKTIIRTEPGLRYDTLNNPVYDDQTTKQTLQQLQFEKQKRLLINLLHLYKVKGTQKCIHFLTSLLGSPEGLIVLNEFVFDTLQGEKIIDNQKYHVPSISYEIDPDYLKNPNNISDPINLPYVYRLKLENEKKVNLREISLGTDPQAAIATQILEFGNTVYSYATFKSGSFVTLQNKTKEYYMLPLNFPDKYYGITVEYMIPRDGLKHGVGQNHNEVTFNLGSLYEVAAITYNGNLEPIKLPAGAQYAYPIPATYNETIQSVALQQRATANFTISNLGIFGQSLEVFVNGVLIGQTSWLSTKQETAMSLVENINFTLSAPNYRAFYIDNANGTYTVKLEAVEGLGSSINGFLVEIKTNGLIDSVNITPNQTINLLQMMGGVDLYPTTNQFIISRIEGEDLVVRMRVRDELGINAVYEYVAICQNLFKADALNHQLRLLFRPEGIEVYHDFKFKTICPWLDPSSALNGPFTSLEISKEEILTCNPIVVASFFINAYPDKDDPSILPNNTNQGEDIARWWDLLVGLPHNIDVYINRVAVFDSLSIDMPDVLDEGVDISGNENEKWSFSLQDQAVDLNNNKLTDRLDITATFRAPNPDAPQTITVIEDYFTNYSNNKVTDIRLLSQNLYDGLSEYIEEVQSFYKLPNGETLTIDGLFKYNTWTSTLHKDYTYETFFNQAYRNYEIFSSQVLTYLALLPFLELIESKFKKLVSQFIPIVINISDFGRIVKNNPFNQLKAHYSNIHHICDGTQSSTEARALFTITGGTYNPSINSIEVSTTALYTIIDASNTTPIVLTCDTNVLIGNGINRIKIEGVGGNTAANTSFGIFTYCDVIAPNQLALYRDPGFTLPIAGNGAYTSGGSVSIYLGYVDWESQNSITASNLALDIDGNISIPPLPLLPPLMTVTAQQTTVILSSDPNKFFAKYGVDINTVGLVVTTIGDATVNNIHPFSGGLGGTLGTCDSFVLTRSLPELQIPLGGPFVYFSSENGLVTYIFTAAEGIPPLYI